MTDKVLKELHEQAKTLCPSTLFTDTTEQVLIALIKAKAIEDAGKSISYSLDRIRETM